MLRGSAAVVRALRAAQPRLPPHFHFSAQFRTLPHSNISASPAVLVFRPDSYPRASSVDGLPLASLGRRAATLAEEILERLAWIFLRMLGCLPTFIFQLFAIEIAGLHSSRYSATRAANCGRIATPDLGAEISGSPRSNCALGPGGGRHNMDCAGAFGGSLGKPPPYCCARCYRENDFAHLHHRHYRRCRNCGARPSAQSWPSAAFLLLSWALRRGRRSTHPTRARSVHLGKVSRRSASQSPPPRSRLHISTDAFLAIWAQLLSRARSRGMVAGR